MVKLNSILIIENDETSNFIMKFVLKSVAEFDSLHSVDNGREACQYLEEHRDRLPDLIFLDLHMPGMDGWEFLDWYEQMDFKQKSRIVIISSSILLEDKQKAQKYADVLDFVDKPLTKETVEKILAGW
ncbi:MAG: response regulator [Cyclobacteriaceae bacterium]|nr:response regulator [Cyclobacteriaceae bacterium]